MSPLVHSPLRGYSDYQRVDNYDSGVLWTTDPGLTGVAQNSPIMDVSRYGYLGGFLAESNSQGLVTMDWWADSAATIRVGRRQFVTYFQNGLARIRLPNLGPFCTVQLAPFFGLQFAPEATVFGTNRVHPLEFIPAQPTLVDQQNVAIAASGILFFYPQDYYAGPVTVWYDPQYASGSYALQYLTQANTWNYVSQFNHTAVNQVTDIRITPAGAWRFQIFNSSGGASAFWLVVTPSTTGAA